MTDFSSFVTKVPSNADFVFFPTQKPADAQNFAQQLLEQGKKAKVFGGDGASARSSSRCRDRTSRSSPRTSARHPVRQAAHRRVEEGQSRSSTSARSGLPSTSRCRLRSTPIKRACDAGKGQIKDRRDVARNVKKIFVKNSILGGDFRFSTKSNDPLNGEFYIFEIQSNGTYKHVTARPRSKPEGGPASGRAALAFSAVDSSSCVDTFVQLTLNGLTLGSVYALIALGYSLVYGILKLLNFAHGDVVHGGHVHRLRRCCSCSAARSTRSSRFGWS